MCVDDKNITLPGGEEVLNATEFRNTFILRPEVEADMFVPCGGRPQTINHGN